MSDSKCLKCGKTATSRFSPDIDIRGIGTCDEHKDEIQKDILIATLDSKGWERFEKKYFNNKK